MPNQPILVNDEGEGNSFEVGELHSNGELPKTILKGVGGSVKIKKFFHQQSVTSKETQEATSEKINSLKSPKHNWLLGIIMQWWRSHPVLSEFNPPVSVIIFFFCFAIFYVIISIPPQVKDNWCFYFQNCKEQFLSGTATTTPYFDFAVDSRNNSIHVFSSNENQFKIKKVSWLYYDDYWKFQPLNNSDNDSLLYQELVQKLAIEVDALMPKDVNATNTMLIEEKISCNGIRHIDGGRFGFREMGIPMVVEIIYDNKLDLKEYATVITLYIENWDGFNFDPHFSNLHREVTQKDAEVFGVKSQLGYVNYLAQDAVKKSIPRKNFSTITYKCVSEF